MESLEDTQQDVKGLLESHLSAAVRRRQRDASARAAISQTLPLRLLALAATESLQSAEDAGSIGTAAPTSTHSASKCP